MKNKKIRLKMNTGILPLIDVGTYGTYLGKIIEENEDTKESNEAFACSCVNNGILILNRIFKEIVKRLVICENGKIDSPSFYNFRNDELDFDMEIELSYVFEIFEDVKKNENDFFQYCNEHYRSYDGFCSFYPYHKAKYYEAIKGADVERAVAMYIMWKMEKEDLSEYQEELEDSIANDTKMYQLPESEE